MTKFDDETLQIEKERERGRKYREENPEKLRECCKKYREENHEKVREATKKYAKSHPEEVKEMHRRWSKKNPSANTMEMTKYRRKHKECELSNGICKSLNEQKNLPEVHISYLSTNIQNT